MWISPPASGTSRWITPGISASPRVYATNARSTASMQTSIGNAARTSASRSTRTVPLIGGASLGVDAPVNLG